MYFLLGNSNLTENSEPLVNELFEKKAESHIKASLASLSVPLNTLVECEIITLES